MNETKTENFPVTLLISLPIEKKVFFIVKCKYFLVLSKEVTDKEESVLLRAEQHSETREIM